MDQNEQIARQIKELKEAQAKLVHSEKVGINGVMTSGIAHEINNPLNFISGGVAGLKSMISDLMVETTKNGRSTTQMAEVKEEIVALLNSIDNGVKRASRIITSQQTFSSPQESIFSEINLIEPLEMALTMLNDKIIASGVKVTRNYTQGILKNIW